MLGEVLKGGMKTYRSVVWRRKSVCRGIKKMSCAETRGGCGDAVASVRNGRRSRSSGCGSMMVFIVVVFGGRPAWFS
jgi:hypothetical protein